MGWLYDLPDTAIKIVASKWTQGGEGPLYDEELADWLVERCGFFPRCWNLDTHLYPLLRKRPNLAQLLVKQESMQRSGMEGIESLIQAFIKGQVECVKGLLAAGLDVNAKLEYGLTPLHFAFGLDTLRFGHPSVWTHGLCQGVAGNPRGGGE